jgi:hypothetical protein
MNRATLCSVSSLSVMPFANRSSTRAISAPA